jgi:chemotaxis protein MotA
MEISTLLGLAIGLVAMAGVLIFGESRVSLAKFVDPAALLMVFGGSAAVMLVGFPMRQLGNLLAIIKKTFLFERDNPAHLVDDLVLLADYARKDGLLLLEERVAAVREPFIILGVQLLVDGTRADVIEEIMGAEIEALVVRHRESKKIVDLVGRCGPAFGMIATLLGLILMLGNLDSPETVGPSMAVALLGTLYGAVLANLICIPLGEKLSYLSNEEVLYKQIVIRGILAIHGGDNPRIVRQKLDTLLPPRERQQAQAAA